VQAFADDARSIAWNGATLVANEASGRLAIRPEATRAEVVAESASDTVSVAGLAFSPQSADGACAIAPTADGAAVSLGRSRVFVLRADAGNSAPAADPGPSPQRATLDSDVALDGSASCDLDGDALTAHWELVSAPGGSAWSLANADTMTPTLHVDRAGPYRVRLVVTDAHGAASRASEFVVLGGPACADRVDEDRDGAIDGLDPQCPSPSEGWGAGCGLVGVEVLPVLLWAGARQRRRYSSCNATNAAVSAP
jgi:hypothetical protein